MPAKPMNNHTTIKPTRWSHEEEPTEEWYVQNHEQQKKTIQGAAVTAEKCVQELFKVDEQTNEILSHLEQHGEKIRRLQTEVDHIEDEEKRGNRLLGSIKSIFQSIINLFKVSRSKRTKTKKADHSKKSNKSKKSKESKKKSKKKSKSSSKSDQEEKKPLRPELDPEIEEYDNLIEKDLDQISNMLNPLKEKAIQIEKELKVQDQNLNNLVSSGEKVNRKLRKDLRKLN